MSRKSTQIAVGGVFSALCLLLMFITGIMPFLTYAMPALAGATLVAVVVENGRRTAVLVYVAVSILSLLIIGDREAVMMFIAFFGYYPILKGSLDTLPRALGYPIKFLLFNVTIVTGYLFIIYLLGLPDLVGDMGEYGVYGAIALLVAGNIVFGIYDFGLARYTSLYIRWFRPTFLRR